MSSFTCKACAGDWPPKDCYVADCGETNAYLHEDQFFTGLKPEVGNGYADFVMSPNVTYTLRLAAGSDIADGLIAPTCQTPSGEAFLGGIKLTFQQP